jgi:hypothetical protein
MLNPWFEDTCSKYYNSEIITDVVSEYALDIDSTTFNVLGLGYNLKKPRQMVTQDPLYSEQSVYSEPLGYQTTWRNCSFSTYTNLLITDGWSFRGKQRAKTLPPKDEHSAKVTMYLIPECSAYVGGYCAISVDCFIDVYKLLGGRQFCTDTSLFWIKGDTTKIGMQLQVSAIIYKSGVYQKQEADFLRSPYNKIDTIKLLHMALASYSNVENLMATSDALCNEIATLIYRDVVIPWNDKAPATSIITDIKNDWLKPSLIL